MKIAVGSIWPSSHSFLPLTYIVLCILNSFPDKNFNNYHILSKKCQVLF